MNIYQRQMKELGLNLDQYSKFLGIPKSITKKIINGNGEVVEDMEINSFLRKNLFGKHQEVENNKEEKKAEALNIKLMRGENSYETKKQWLLEKYPNSEEVKWYINEYNKKEYFEKHDIQNRADLMRRYKFTCKTGRLKNQKEVGITTIERLTEKKYDELGTQSAYPLICQLYDCLALGNIKKRTEKARSYYYSGNAQKGKRGFQTNEYTEEEQKLINWFYTFDLKGFGNAHDITTTQMARDLKTSGSTIKAIKKGTYKPSMKLAKRLKDYVDSFENKVEIQTTIDNIETFNIPVVNEHLEIMENNNEEILRNLLKDRLTEEEKTLIRIFGGRI